MGISHASRLTAEAAPAPPLAFSISGVDVAEDTRVVPAAERGSKTSVDVGVRNWKHAGGTGMIQIPAFLNIFCRQHSIRNSY